MSETTGTRIGHSVRAALLTSLAIAGLAACAGGGGQGPSPSPILQPSPPPPPPLPPPPPPPPPPGFFETGEYSGTLFSQDRNTITELIGASSAYSRGATGEGIVVAVIDTNVDTTISELTGQFAGFHDVCASAVSGCSAARLPSDIDTDGHATMVAGVIVARKDNVGIHGVAYDAKILAIRADRPGTCQETGDAGGCRFSDASLINAVNYAVANGARIINMSLGSEGAISAGLRNAIIAATSQGVLFTIAAGNEAAAPSGTQPAKGTAPTEPAIVAGDPAVGGRVVAVGAVDPSGAMPTFSNRAGPTASFYLLAPGVSIVLAGIDDNIRRPDLPTCGGSVTTNCNDANDDGNFWIGSGTSFAAPAVAGALALMLDLFPNLTPEAALRILLDTADDYITTTPDPVLGVSAVAGTDSVGGRGIMNLRRAFAPQGTAVVSFGGSPVTLTQALAPASGALGDWAEVTGAFDGLVFQDRYMRGFRLETTRLMPSASRFGDFSVRADVARGEARAAALGPARLSWFSAPASVYDPRYPWKEAPDPNVELSYAFGDTQIALGRGGAPAGLGPSLMLLEDRSGHGQHASGGSWTQIAHAIGPLVLDARASEGAGRSASGVGISGKGRGWALRAGYAALSDEMTALGGALQSRFGGDDEARMAAVSLEASLDAASWRLSGSVEAAQPRFQGLDVSGLWTSSWSLSAGHAFAGGWLRFSLAQPRRAEEGMLVFRAPVELTRSGRLVYAARRADLTPSGRELDVEAAWTALLGGRTRIEGVLALASQPGHKAGARNEGAVWLSLRHAW